MRMEFYLLAIVAAAAVASAVVPRRSPVRSGPPEKDEPARVVAESATGEFASFEQLSSHVAIRVEEIRRLIAKAMNDASGHLDITNFKRGLLEDCIRRAETALREQDAVILLTGHITPAMESDYLKSVEGLDRLETSWIWSQQKVQASVQEINDHAFGFMSLAQELAFWKLDNVQPIRGEASRLDKSQHIREEASRLYDLIVSESGAVYQASGKMHAEACVDPVGIDVKGASPLVTNFRAERAAARAQIRLRLAQAAKEKRS